MEGYISLANGDLKIKFMPIKAPTDHLFIGLDLKVASYDVSKAYYKNIGFTDHNQFKNYLGCANNSSFAIKLNEQDKSKLLPVGDTLIVACED
jgi:hypothetical protein